MNRHEIESILARVDLKPEVRIRLEWFLYYIKTRSVSATCRKFGIARTTFYRWLRRYTPDNLSSLEDKPKIVPRRISTCIHTENVVITENKNDRTRSYFSEEKHRQKTVQEIPDNTSFEQKDKMPVHRIDRWAIFKRTAICTSIITNLLVLCVMAYVLFQEREQSKLNTHFVQKDVEILQKTDSSFGASIISEVSSSLLNK